MATFILANYFYGGRSQAKPSGAAVAAPIIGQGQEPSEPVVPRELAIEEVPPIPVTPAHARAPIAAPEEDKAVRLRRAFESGRLSREAYEANLRKLGLAVSINRPREEAPPIEVAAAPVSPPIASPEDKAVRLREAFESGRLSREAYEANLRKLGLGMEAPPAPAATPAPSLSGAAKVERLTQAFVSGRITKAAYEENLRKLGLEPEVPRAASTSAPPMDDAAKVERLRQAYAAGRIPKAAYEDNLRKLGIEPEHEEVTTMLPKPKPADSAQDKAAKLRAAFEAGKIPRELYERNLRALGVEPEPAPVAAPAPAPVVAPLPPDYRIERLHIAFRSGRMPRELYERNVRALGGEPMPAPDPAEPAPPPPDERAERAAHVTKAFEAAFEESRVPREVNDRELAAVEGGHAAPPPPDLRVARVREAYEAGRISRDTYERNLHALGALEAVNPPPPPPAEEPVAPPASVPEAPVANPLSPASARLLTEFEERVDLLTRLFVEGKLSKSIYEKNLARTYEAVDPRLAQLRIAHEEGRISKDVYDTNVRRVLQARGAP